MVFSKWGITIGGQPGPLDERPVTWNGADLWRLIGTYVGFAFLGYIALDIIGLYQAGAENYGVSSLGDGLALAGLLYSQARHHFWPNAAYWQLTLADFKRHWRQGVLWGVGAQIGGSLLGLLCTLAASAAGIDPSRLEGNNPLEGIGFGPVWLLVVIQAVVLAPLIEELFFRGMFYGLLRQRHGVRAALMVSSLVFAGGHLSWIGFISFFAAGIILCLLYERTGSLAPCMVAHATHNLVSTGIATLFALLA